MPFQPGITDQSGMILAQGIQRATSSAADTVQRLQLTQQEMGVLGGKVAAYGNMGVLPPEDLQAFASGNLAKKREIASKGDVLYHQQQQMQITPVEAARLSMQGQVAGAQIRNDDARTRILQEDFKRKADFTPKMEITTLDDGTQIIRSQETPDYGRFTINQPDAPKQIPAPVSKQLPDGTTIFWNGNTWQSARPQQEDKLGQLLAAGLLGPNAVTPPAGAPQAAAPAPTATPAPQAATAPQAQSTGTVWRKGKDGRLYEFDATTKKATGRWQ